MTILMHFAEGQVNYHIHCPIVFFHKFKILSVDLQNFIRTQEANKSEGVDGMECPSCHGPPPLMYGFCLCIMATRGLGVMHSI